MPRIIPNKASTRDYTKVQEGEEEDFRGYGPYGEAVAVRKKKRSFPYGEMDYSANSANIYTPGRSNAVPSTATPANEPPPTFNDRDWNLKTG